MLIMFCILETNILKVLFFFLTRFPGVGRLAGFRLTTHTHTCIHMHEPPIHINAQTGIFSNTFVCSLLCSQA